MISDCKTVTIPNTNKMWYCTPTYDMLKVSETPWTVLNSKEFGIKHPGCVTQASSLCAMSDHLLKVSSPVYNPCLE